MGKHGKRKSNRTYSTKSQPGGKRKDTMSVLPKKIRQYGKHENAHAERKIPKHRKRNTRRYMGKHKNKNGGKERIRQGIRKGGERNEAFIRRESHYGE